MENLKKSNPPKVEVLAGGGAILAKTGKRISIGEAELIATAAIRPEVAAIAESGPSNASSAVAAAVAEQAAATDMAVPGSDDDADMSDYGDDDNAAGKAESDHLRRPILKDTTKAQRQRPRANQVKRKSKAPTPKKSPQKSPKKKA